MTHYYLLEPTVWLRLAIALATLLVLVAAYGLAAVEVVAARRRLR
jgi:hypothetical protein